MADKYDTPLLRPESLITSQYLDERAGTFPTWKMVSRAYGNLPDDSPFCGYLVDMFRRYWTSDPQMCVCEPQSEREAAKFKNIPPAFMFQMMHEYEHSLRDDLLDELSWCKFHEHGSKDENKACRAWRVLKRRVGSDDDFYAYPYPDTDSDDEDNDEGSSEST